MYLIIILLLFFLIYIYKYNYSFDVYNPKNIKRFNRKRRQQIPKPIINTWIDTFEPPIKEIEIIFMYDFENNEFDNLVRETENQQRTINDLVMEDDQSVHDNKIQRRLRHEWKDMIQNDIDENTINEIIENSPKDLKPIVERVVQKIKLDNSTMSGYGDEKLSNIISNIYKSLKTEDEKDVFYKSFRDCINETNNVVCSTGIVSQLMLSKFLDKPEKFPKPQNFIFQEILQSASNIRKENENDEEFKKKFTEKIHADYNDILTQEEIQKHVDEICNNM